MEVKPWNKEKKGIRLKTYFASGNTGLGSGPVMLYDQVRVLLQDNHGTFEGKRGRVYTGWSGMEGVLDWEAWELSVTGAECPGFH